MEERENQKLNEELRTRDIKKTLEFGKMCEIYAAMKLFIQDGGDDVNLEYLDAFVFLGGSTDRSGHVTKDFIIATLKNEFDLDIDLEALLD